MYLVRCTDLFPCSCALFSYHHFTCAALRLPPAFLYPLRLVAFMARYGYPTRSGPTMRALVIMVNGSPLLTPYLLFLLFYGACHCCTLFDFAVLPVPARVRTTTDHHQFGYPTCRVPSFLRVLALRLRTGFITRHCGWLFAYIIGICVFVLTTVIRVFKLRSFLPPFALVLVLVRV